MKLYLEKRVNNRKSSKDKNVLTELPESLMSGSLGFEWSAHMWVVLSLIISLYSDAVLNRNADYTVIDWLGSTVG